MRVAVWGAGNLGVHLAYRLCVSPHVSEIHWINRSYERISRRRIDAEHGLAFAPTCRTVRAYKQDSAERALKRSDVLVLVAGHPVPRDGSRDDVYEPNCEFFRSDAVPRLAGFDGIVVVVTNPVDLMARFVHREAHLDAERVIGLGTVVETARLRAALADRLRPTRHPRDVWALAVGTHDERFVAVAPEVVRRCLASEQSDLRAARSEVARGAARVKESRAGGALRSSIHPIVEGVVHVVETIASDAHRLLTVSVFDPSDPDGLFYSMPCRVGRGGVTDRQTWVVQEPGVAEGLDACREALRISLAGTD